MQEWQIESKISDREPGLSRAEQFAKRRRGSWSLKDLITGLNGEIAKVDICQGSSQLLNGNE